MSWASSLRWAALAGLVLVACGEPERSAKPAGSALWVEPGALVGVEPGELDRLREARVGELFVAGAELAWDGERPRIEAGESIALPRRAPVTLVVAGRWPTVPPSDPERFGGELGGELEKLRLTAEARGLLVIGVHLDLRGIAAAQLEALAEGLATAAGGLGDGRYLSIELDRAWLGSDGVERLAAAVDFVSCRLYGQPVEAREDPTLWRHDDVLATVGRLEELGEDYLIGVVTTGGLRRLDAAGSTMAADRGGASVAGLVRSRSFERVPGGLLEGLDRRVMTFDVVGPATVGEWRLTPGERLRTVQLREHDLRRLLARLGAAGLNHRLGELYVGAPRAGERLALSLGELAAAAGGYRLPVDLRAELREVRSVRGGLAFRVAAINGGERDTDVAYLASNYLEVQIPGGTLASVESGDFLRAERRRDGRTATDMIAFRNADSVRLFVPLLEAGDIAVSGPIVVRTGSGRVRLGGSFSLPGGETFELAESGLP